MKKTILLLLTPLLIYLFINPTPTTQKQAEVNPDKIEWLKKQIHPLKTFDPKDENFEDLNILDSIVANRKIVALGEVTHGSSEIFKMKHRIIKCLNEKHEFDIFSIEGNMPEANKVNEYIIDKKGDPIELIRGMHFWIWRTQEVLDMVEWMRVQNDNGKPIKFSGFDMQYYNGAIEELKSNFKNKKETEIAIQNLSETLDSIKAKTKRTYLASVSDLEKNKINKLLSKIQDGINLSEFDDATKKWLLQNTRIIEQCIDNKHSTRDKYMAENVEWIKQQNPNSKTVLWAHNSHVKKKSFYKSRSMGGYLSESLKEDYLTIGFTFHKGNYTAKSKEGPRTYPAEESYEGTYEYIFQQLEEPIFLLDLRKIKKDTTEYGKWFKQRLPFRATGASKPKREFIPTNLVDDFDLIIFINESSSSTVLK